MRIIIPLVLVGACWAQPTQVVIIPGSPPGGAGAACTDTAHGYLAATGVIYTCQSSVWTAPGGGGGASIPSTTNLIKGSGSGNGADSGIVPANVPLLDANNVFTGTQTIGSTVLEGGGTSLPGTCPVGALYFLTTGTTGLYECTSPNAWTLPGGTGSMTWPGAAGLAVYGGSSAWGSSLTAPAGAIVGTTDTQTLTNKTVDGVTPTTFGYLDPTSSVQTQLNGKAGSTAATTVNGQTCTLGSACTVADSTKVPTTTTVNAHALSGNVTVTSTDVHPSSAGAAPTAGGDIQYDSTQARTVAGGAGATTGSFPRVLYAVTSNAANNMISTDGGTYNSLTSTNGCPAGSCAPTAVADSWTVPANYLTTGKMLRVTLALVMTTSASTPNPTFYLYLGSGAICTLGAFANSSGQTNLNFMLQYLVSGTATPGSSVNVYCSAFQGMSASGAFNSTNASAATNSSLALTPYIKFAAATAANMMQVRSMLVEELN